MIVSCEPWSWGEMRNRIHAAGGREMSDWWAGAVREEQRVVIVIKGRGSEHWMDECIDRR